MPSLVDILEAVYRIDRNERDWLEGLLLAARPHLDRGLGIFGYRFDTRQPPAEWGAAPVTIGATPEFHAGAMALLRAAHAGQMSASMRQRIYFNDTPRISSTSELLFGGASIKDDPTFGPAARKLGFADFFGFRCSDPVGAGCIVGGFSPEVVRTTPAAQHRWSRIAAHIDAALRLRATMTAVGEEAVFTQGGRIEHAEPAATDKLGELRQAVDKLRWIRSRTGRSRDDEALDLWRVLVHARWSLVERVETTGRRYLVARRNQLAPPDLPKLSRSERVIAYYLALGRQNKLIAYELGIAEGTVASFVARLRKKLRAGSRAVLVSKCSELLENALGGSDAEIVACDRRNKNTQG